jgi:hypothetical protein
MMDIYKFPTCIHVLSAALHRENVDPKKIVITMPFDEWWRLSCALQRKDLCYFDGRGNLGDHFMYLGITFKADKK